MQVRRKHVFWILGWSVPLTEAEQRGLCCQKKLDVCYKDCHLRGFILIKPMFFECKQSFKVSIACVVGDEKQTNRKSMKNKLIEKSWKPWWKWTTFRDIWRQTSFRCSSIVPEYCTRFTNVPTLLPIFFLHFRAKMKGTVVYSYVRSKKLPSPGYFLFSWELWDLFSPASGFLFSTSALCPSGR